MGFSTPPLTVQRLLEEFGIGLQEPDNFATHGLGFWGLLETQFVHVQQATVLFKRLDSVCVIVPRNTHTRTCCRDGFVVRPTRLL